MMSFMISIKRASLLLAAEQDDVIHNHLLLYSYVLLYLIIDNMQ